MNDEEPVFFVFRSSFFVPLLDAATAVAFGAAIVIGLTGGGTFAIGDFSLSARHASRPLAAGIVLLVVRLVLILRGLGKSDGGRPRHLGGTKLQLPVAGRETKLTLGPTSCPGPATAAVGIRLRPDAPMSATCAAVRIGFGTILVAAAGLWFTANVETCGGADSYGYVSAAQLILEGRLRVPQPIVAELPFDSSTARAIASPLSYGPAIDADAIVPTYPLGLPLLMALFQAVIGARGPFLVSPVMAVVTIAALFACEVAHLRVHSPFLCCSCDRVREGT